jgi:hypothetical protein
MVFMIDFWKPGLSNREEFNFQKEGPLVTAWIALIVISTPA